MNVQLRPDLRAATGIYQVYPGAGDATAGFAATTRQPPDMLTDLYGLSAGLTCRRCDEGTLLLKFPLCAGAVDCGVITYETKGGTSSPSELGVELQRRTVAN